MSWNPFGWMQKKATHSGVEIANDMMDELKPRVQGELNALKDEFSHEVDRKLDQIDVRLDTKLDDVEVRVERTLDDAEARVDAKLDRVLTHFWGGVVAIGALVIGTIVVQHTLED